MKSKQNEKYSLFAVLILVVMTLSSCERHKYCAECWENRPLFSIGSGDISFCSDDVRMVDDFIYDYERWGWWCEFRD